MLKHQNGPFVIQNEMTGAFVANEMCREHESETTDNIHAAAHFRTRAEASEFSQNYGPEFNVIEARNAN